MAASDTVTVTIAIGNSDNKLSQYEWASYVKNIRSIVESYADEVHFAGGPENWAPWQNFCFVFQMPEVHVSHLKSLLSGRRASYQQESVSVIVGQVEFV